MTVLEVKEHLSRRLLVGIPPSKFVLKGTHKMVALKESQSLAFYNIAQSATLVFSLK
jgi:hypothetical protein